MAQQVVDFYLPGGVQHGKPLESRLLVGGVVIDAGARVLGKPFDHEVDSGLEGGLLLLAAVGPERVEPLVLLLCGYHAEQVLESALKQGIAPHVEEHVTGIRLWQAGESATRLRSAERLVGEGGGRTGR